MTAIHNGQPPMRQIDTLAMPMFDWVMVPVAALADAFFGMLHMRLPDYVRSDRTVDGLFADLAGERTRADTGSALVTAPRP